jgi:hypothetical protein
VLFLTPASRIPHPQSPDLLDSTDYAADTSRIDLAARRRLLSCLGRHATQVF